MNNDSRADILFSFLRRRGVGALSMIVEQLNCGTAQKRIALMLGMDAGQFSRFIHATLVQEYHVAPDVADMIELFQQLERRNADRALGNVLSMGERPRVAANGDTGRDDPGISRAARMLPVFILADWIALEYVSLQCLIV